MAEAIARTRCYDIFSISKVVAVSTEEELYTVPKPADKPVTINAVASGGNEREKFLAVFLSNDFLLFHYYSQVFLYNIYTCKIYIYIYLALYIIVNIDRL